MSSEKPVSQTIYGGTYWNHISKFNISLIYQSNEYKILFDFKEQILLLRKKFGYQIYNIQ